MFSFLKCKVKKNKIPLTKPHWNIKICLGSATDPEAVVMFKYETASQTIFSTTLYTYFYVKLNRCKKLNN